MVALLVKKIFGRLGGWVGAHLVQDVPEEIAACEFDCSKPECEGAELINCERRIRVEAAERRTRGGSSEPPSGYSDQAAKPAP